MGVELSCEDEQQADLVPVPVVLNRVGRELRQLAATVEDLQALIGGLVVERACADAGPIYQLQKIDLLRQELSGVADFVAALAPSAGADWLVDPAAATRTLTLSDLAARLSSIDRKRDLRDDASAGDCEFY